VLFAASSVADLSSVWRTCQLLAEAPSRWIIYFTKFGHAPRVNLCCLQRRCCLADVSSVWRTGQLLTEALSRWVYARCARSSRERVLSTVLFAASSVADVSSVWRTSQLLAEAPSRWVYENCARSSRKRVLFAASSVADVSSVWRTCQLLAEALSRWVYEFITRHAYSIAAGGHSASSLEFFLRGHRQIGFFVGEMQHSLAAIAYLFFSRCLSANKESTRVFGVCNYGAFGFALRVFRVKVLRTLTAAIRANAERAT
jgi:hypothetical protein